MSATARLRHRLPDDLPRGAVTRFAPSPTGLLHLGHAHAALFAAACARAAGGRFLLRLEDIDATRCRPEFAAAILDDLAWLGLAWEGRARDGVAWDGVAREGLASDGVASGGVAWEGRARDGVVGDRVAPKDLAHDGVASGGVAREGRARDGVVGDRVAPEELARDGPASDGVAREGVARDGMPPDGPVRVQSQHMSDYRAALDRLAARGLLYPCFCTRADIQREVAASGQAPHGPDGPLYPGTCRRLSAAGRAARLARGEPHALRLDMAAALAVAPRDLSFHELGEGRIRCDPAAFGDAVLARKDTPASYHLCVTHDDALQGVTLVTRGVDLKPATHLHRLLQALLGWPEPAYAHHALLTGPDGRRLAKRDGAPTLRACRDAGRTPAELRALAGFD